MTTPENTPSSWRDVYRLVRDLHNDQMAAVARVEGKVEKVDVRLSAIEDARIAEENFRKGEREVIGTAAKVARIAVAVGPAILAAGAFLIALIR